MPVFYCDECSLRFHKEANLKEHYQRTHTQEKRYKCDACGESFSKKIDLSRHMRTHTGETLHQCHLCERSCSTKNNLKKHIQQVHTNQRPYKCHVCGKGFIANNVLEQHLKSHEKGTIFYCPVCPTTEFRRGDYFAEHMSKYHPDHPGHQLSMNSETIPGVGVISSVCHTLTSQTTCVVTSVAQITYPAGTIIYTQTTTAGRATSTSTSTSTRSSTSTGTAQPLNPQLVAVTETVSQESGAVSCAQHTEPVELDLKDILDSNTRGFSSWQDDPEKWV